MKEQNKKLDLKSFYRDSYNGSDLQTINRNNPMPHKCTIKGQNFYYYNADLSGLMWIQGEDRKLKYSEFVDSYRKGFAEGLKHLKAKEGIKRKDFYNANKKEELKRVLHSFLYKRDFLPNHKGLRDLITKTILRWSDDNIYTQGYYNGLLHSILTLSDQLNIDVFEAEKFQQNVSEKPTKKKIGYKYYSLLYWMELNANGESPPMNFEGDFIREEIEAEGRKKKCGKGQHFYREFRNIKEDLNNLDHEFGKDWKETIIQLSNNDSKIIDYIEKQYPK